MVRMKCAIVVALLASGAAVADDTLQYRSEGGCAGDFDRVQLKALYLRVDAGGETTGSTMIYDHGEKLAYFIDHRTHTFMQTEMDEDAIDLQSDIMKSLGIKMRRESGVDPFEMAKSICPGMNAGSRDRLPDEGIDCGNGTAMGGAMIGADGKPMTNQQMAEAMKSGGGMQLDAGTQEMMQKMIEQQLAQLPADQRAQMQGMMANGGGMPVAGSKAPAPAAPPRIDRDAGEIDVGGITCARREHLRGDQMLREDCYATPTTLHLGEVETRRIARFSQSIREWSQSLVPAGAKQPKDDRVLVRRICYASGQESGRATLTIERAPIAESRFEVPAGYKPMDLGMGGAGGREPR